MILCFFILRQNLSTFYPFLSNFIPITSYDIIWYRRDVYFFTQFFSLFSAFWSKDKKFCQEKQDSTLEMADFFELHELANRSFTWSKYGRKCLFLFQKRRTVEVKFKERKKKHLRFFSRDIFFVPLGFKVWDEYLWLCTARNWLANICAGALRLTWLWLWRQIWF